MEDGKTHEKSELLSQLAQHFKLTPKDMAVKNSKNKPRFKYKMEWACTDLKKAELITYPEKSHYRITEEGKSALVKNPQKLNETFLNQYPSYQQFKHSSHSNQASPSKVADKAKEAAPVPPQSPSQFDADKFFAEEKRLLAEKIRSKLFTVSPKFFEELVVKLLGSMGYGIAEGVVVGKPGDKGIDGIISEDKLGFSKIYIQAKRWAADQTVSRPDLQQFYGALADTGATQPKGLFITTTRFSSEAREYAEKKNIILIDGSKLAELMIDYDLGVSTKKTYTLKEIDTDFFKEEEP